VAKRENQPLNRSYGDWLAAIRNCVEPKFASSPPQVSNSASANRCQIRRFELCRLRTGLHHLGPLAQDSGTVLAAFWPSHGIDIRERCVSSKSANVRYDISRVFSRSASVSAPMVTAAGMLIYSLRSATRTIHLPRYYLPAL
jgi:hypothetical protein